MMKRDEREKKKNLGYTLKFLLQHRQFYKKNLDKINIIILTKITNDDLNKAHLLSEKNELPVIFK